MHNCHMAGKSNYALKIMSHCKRNKIFHSYSFRVKYHLNLFPPPKRFPQ